MAEYQEDKSLEEMADVLEVLFAICEARGHSLEELMAVRDEKRERDGAALGKGYFGMETYDNRFSQFDTRQTVIC